MSDFEDSESDSESLMPTVCLSPGQSLVVLSQMLSLQHGIVLPIEIVRAVLSHLKRRSLFRCRRVSKTFYEIVHSLQFHSLDITCNPRFKDDEDNLPTKARTEHKSLDFVQENPWLTRFVKRVAFDMAYCAHAVALFQQARRLHAHAEIISTLLQAAFAELHLFSHVESFTLGLYGFACARAFDRALLQHACHLPFWSKLKHLEIKHSIFNEEDPPDSDSIPQQTHAKIWRIVALAPQIHSLQLSIGEYNIEPVLDCLPNLPILPNLTVLDIHCDIAPELALSGVPSIIFKWIAHHQHHLTNLNLRMPYHEGDAYREASPRQCPLPKDVTVFARLTFFSVDCVFWPKILASNLAIAAPQLRHLFLEIEDEALEDMVDSVKLLPNLLILSLHCAIPGLQRWTNHFAALSPRLVSLKYYGRWDTDIIGSGTVALSVLDRLSLQQDCPMGHKVLSSLLSSFTGPLELYVLYTGNGVMYRDGGGCDQCRPFWPSVDFFRRRGAQCDKEADDCERLMVECRSMSEQLQAKRSTMNCRVDVFGHGQPGSGCRRCKIAEASGAMSAVRELRTEEN